MKELSISTALLEILLIAAAPCPGAERKPKGQPDPKVSSIYPFAVRLGSEFQAVVRGSDLAGARSLVFGGKGIEARVLGVDQEPAAPGEKTGRDLLRVNVTVSEDAAAGKQEFRVLNARIVLLAEHFKFARAPQIVRPAGGDACRIASAP